MSPVDVIVPCYRYGHYLRECVTSVLTQATSTVRVLVIDDASPDKTAEVARQLCLEDSRVQFIRHATNKGHIRTYNEGIEWVSADYMLLLSADDYLLPYALLNATRLMDAHPEMGFTFGSAVDLFDDGATRQVTPLAAAFHDAAELILTGRQFIKASGVHNIVPTPTAVVRTALQKRVGGYRPELPHAGDMEMWLRLAAHGPVGVIKACQAVYRLHANNMSRDHYRNAWWLPDLRQRKLAVDCFAEGCGDLLDDARAQHQRMCWLLGRDAVGWASAAFNEGAMEASEQLLEFALSTCPEIRTSLPWIKLACKRRLGLRGWQALQPGIVGIRKVLHLRTENQH